MKHVIIGMAGHVDHGKTELVKALTGVDTDRLAEEKKRGITIDLGFARLDFPDGSCASIVDVPGHERFIKNMLAGAGGVDLAMLVVAADEGFMPQTVEHLDILQLLGVKDGLIVLTKTDLVDEDWLNMLEEDVKSRVKGTFLEDKPILRTSVRTGEGVEALREALHDLTLHAEEKSARTPFRLPIDRVFSVDGFGTIVTGTLIDGHIAVGDKAQLMPLGNKCRVRNLQVHGRDVSAVYAGQRAAVNLAGIKKESISRGDVLCRPDSMQPSLMLDVKLQNLPDSKRIIESGSRLHLYHGAAVRLAKAVLLDRDVDLCWILMEAAQMAPEIEKQLDIRLTVDHSPFRRCYVKADAQEAEQLLFHLLSNALRAVSPGGQIKIRLTRDDEDLYLIVEDDGCGLPTGENWMENRRRFLGGVQAGLLLCRRYCAHMGWVLSLTPRDAGSGTRAEVRIPLAGTMFPIEGSVELHTIHPALTTADGLRWQILRELALLSDKME